MRPPVISPLANRPIATHLTTNTDVVLVSPKMNTCSSYLAQIYLSPIVAGYKWAGQRLRNQLILFLRLKQTSPLTTCSSLSSCWPWCPLSSPLPECPAAALELRCPRTSTSRTAMSRPAAFPWEALPACCSDSALVS